MIKKELLTEFTTINGLRALALVMVFSCHQNTTFSANDGLFGKVLASGWIGVHLFFVISAFLLSLKIIDKLERGTFSLSNYLKKRFLKIVPPFYFLLIILQLYHQGSIDLSNYFLFLQNSSATAAHTPLLFLWTIAAQVHFYLILPIILMMIYHFSPTKQILILVGIASLSYIYRYHFYVINKHFTISVLDSFIYSMVAAIAYRNEFQFKKICHRYLNIISIFAAAISITTLLLPPSTFKQTSMYAAQGIFFAILLLTTLSPRHILHKLLISRTLSALAKISFSVYLVHFFIIMTVFNILSQLQLQMLIGHFLYNLILFTASALLTLITGTLYYKLLEKRKLKLLDKLKQWSNVRYYRSH